MPSRFGFILAVSSIVSFCISLVASDTISAALVNNGVKLSDILLKVILRPVFGPNGIQMFPAFRSEYGVDWEAGDLHYVKKNVEIVWKLYSEFPSSFVIDKSQYDQNGDCWPKDASGFYVNTFMFGGRTISNRYYTAIALTNINPAAPVHTDSRRFDAIVCTVIEADEGIESYIDPTNGKLTPSCHRSGCATIVYHRFGGIWRRVFESPECQSISLLDTAHNGVRDLFCSGFGNAVFRWNGQRYERG